VALHSERPAARRSAATGREIDKPCEAGFDLNPSTQVARVQSTVALRGYDRDQTRAHLEMIHELAAELDGILVLAIYGQNPDAQSASTSVALHFADWAKACQRDRAAQKREAV